MLRLLIAKKAINSRKEGEKPIYFKKIVKYLNGF